MFTFGYLFSRMSWLNKCFHRYFSQYLSLYEVFNVHSLRKAKPLEVSSKLLYQSTFISNAFGSGQLHSFMFLTEWRWRDSNSWPPACKAGALPTELHPHLDFYSIQRLSPMGLSGLEPPTSRLSGVRSNRLSYKPISIWQPPAFPYRHQYSIIGRFRLNHRVRDVDGCFPKAHRHQKYDVIYSGLSLVLVTRSITLMLHLARVIRPIRLRFHSILLINQRLSCLLIRQSSLITKQWITFTRFP